MGRIVRSGGRRRALLVLVPLIALAPSGCILLKPPFTPAHVTPPPPPPNAAFSSSAFLQQLGIVPSDDELAARPRRQSS